MIATHPEAALAGLRVGLIGLGFIGQIHLRSWRALGIEPVALRPPEKSRSVTPDGLTLHDDVASLMADVEMVDICTPTHVHSEFVLAAAAAGRHAVCEKPLSSDPVEAARMRRACSEAGTRLFAAHAVRYFAEYGTIRDAVAAGAVGRLGVIRLARESHRPGGGDGGWLFDVSLSGGIVFDLMVHDLDYALWLAGPVEEVFARGVATRGQGLYDHVLALLSHACGALTHVTASWSQVAPVFETRIEVAGADGLLSYDSRTAQEEVWRRRGGTAAPSPAVGLPGSVDDVATEGDPFVAELRDFALAVRTGARPKVDARDGERAVEVAAAVARSLATGLPVKVEGPAR